MTHLDDVRLQRLSGGEAPTGAETAHLSACEPCRATIEAYRAIGEVLSTLRPGPLPADFTLGVLARIDARRTVLRRQFAAALALPVAALGAFAAAWPDAAALSVAGGVRTAADGLAIVARIARVLSPFVSAWGPYLALAAVCLAAASIPIVRLALEVPMRSRSRSVLSAVVFALAIPGVARAQATAAPTPPVATASPVPRSPRLEGEWPALERRVSLDLDGTSPEEALRKLGEAAGWSVIVPGVEGRPITMHLQGVPADAALSSLLESWDLRARRTGSLVTILAPTPQPNVIFTPPPPPALPVVPAAPVAPLAAAGDRVATGDDLVIREGERVNDVAVMGGDLDVRGEVLGDVSVVGGELRVRRTGHVHGDASVVGGELRLEDGGRIDGMRSAIGTGAAADVVGRLARPTGHRSRGFSGVVSDVFGTLARGVAFFVLALLLSVFAKDRINVVTEEIKKRPLHAFGTGLVAAVAVPVLTILLCVVVIGIPVVPFLWLGAVLATFAGMTSIALLVGEKVPLFEKKKTQIVALALGAGVLTILDLIPWVGALAIVSTSLVAFGAVVRTRFAKPNGKAAPPADEFAYRTPA